MNTICIVLSHTGGIDPITFVVTDPRDSSDTIVILNPGDPDATVCLDDWPCGDYVIPVTQDGVPEDQNVTVACGENPVVEVELDCGDGTVLVTVCALTEDCPSSVDVVNPYTLAVTTLECTPDIEECTTLELPCGQEWTVEIYNCFGDLINEVVAYCDCPGCSPMEIQGFSRV